MVAADHEAAAERRRLAVGQARDDEGGRHEDRDGDAVGDVGHPLAAEGAEHQQRHRADREQQLGRGRRERGHLGGIGHRPGSREVMAARRFSPR
jgi:hypothetical protein